MTASKPPKKPAAPKTPAADQAQDFSILDIYERLNDGTRAGHLVEVGWTTHHGPPPSTLADDDTARLPADWPVPARPRRSFPPRGGHGTPKAPEAADVMVVALFGVTAERIADTVRRIDRQYRSTGSFRPIFLTDNPDSSAFRHAGFTHEYFPTAIYGAEDRTQLFRDRFQMLWQKWKGARLIDFSAPGFLASRIEDLERYFQGQEAPEKFYSPRRAKAAELPRPTTDVIALKADYMASGLDQEADTFVLYRILGNDLPPRHEMGQTLNNLRFLLDHEPDLPGCEKRWVVNRVVDPEQEAAIIALLTERDQPFLHIPFVLEDYAKAGWDIAAFPGEAFFLRGPYTRMDEYDRSRADAHVRRFKNNYVINNNGARNAALQDGRGRAKWVLPWDGNCFLTTRAWTQIVRDILAKPYLKYFLVPMSRTLENSDLLSPDYQPVTDSEPQMVFRRNATEEFSPQFYYGRRPKVELFYRLGVPGNWDSWPDDVWDLPRPARSPDAGSVGQAGWVARLFSGQKQLEVEQTIGLRSRGEARNEAITQMIDRLDIAAITRVHRPEDLIAYDAPAVAALARALPGSPEERLHERLLREADLALQRGPFSVVHKTMLPPSGDRHDYFHPAPYWWPNPATPSGMPFVFRDGERIPGTHLYEPESDRYDRTRLQRLFDDTTALALGWLACGADRYIDHAARLIRTWFLDEATRMNPHLLYSQVRSQTPDDVGASSGLIEMKDLYYFLDAVRLVERAGRLSEPEKAQLRAWLSAYLDWLQTSEQGVAERLAKNNHGTCFDLQTGAIAAFIGDAALLEKTFFTSRERILEQFTKDGQQPHEMRRTQTAHYCAFNLQCWVNLATLAEACGHDLWSFEGSDGRGLARAFAWFVPHLAQKTWKYQQIKPFDRSRFLPLFFSARARVSDASALRLSEDTEGRPIFYAHDGIKPFWMLGRAPAMVPQTVPWAALAPMLRKLEEPAFDLLHGRAAVADAAVDLRELDRKLWGGFSGPASADLLRVRDDTRLDEKDRTRAARSLARWSFTRGDDSATLEHSAAMVKLGVSGERERALLRAFCLNRLGRTEDAARTLAAPLSLFSKDASLCLAMANIERSRGLAGQAGTDWAGWINRVYRQAGMADLLKPDANSGRPWTGLLAQDAPGDTAATGADGPLVSVILAIPAGVTPSDGAIASILAQTWRNIEVLVVDASGLASVARALKATARSDQRLSVHPVVAGTPVHDCRNLALARARGSHVVAIGAFEHAHPARLALQLEPLLSGQAVGALVRHIRMTADGHVQGSWSPDFSLMSDLSDGVMVATETLRALGGWDAASGNLGAFLTWRLKRQAGDDALRIVRPHVPLCVVLDDGAQGTPTHLDFPFGRLRTEFRALLRRVNGAEAAGSPAPLGRFDPPGPAPQRFDTVFIGDFSARAVAIIQIRELLRSAGRIDGPVGLFHWPDSDTTWSDELDADVATVIDSGLIRQLSAHEPAKTRRIVLCNPFVVRTPIDGLPNLSPEQVDVLWGPEFHSIEFDHGHRVPVPTLAELERLLGGPCGWATL